MEEFLPGLKAWMVKEVIPRYANMVGSGEVMGDELARKGNTTQNVRSAEAAKRLTSIVQKVTENPKKVLTYVR